MQNSQRPKKSQDTYSPLELAQLVGGLAIVAGVAGWWLLGRPSAGPFLLAGYALVVLGALVLSAATWVRTRAGRTSRLAAILAPELGSNWSPNTGLRASRYKRGNPTRVVINYPASMPDHETEWRDRLANLVRARTGAEKLHANWDERHNRVTFMAVVVTALERNREAVTARIHRVLKGFFRGVDLGVEVTEWGNPDTTKPVRIRLKYGTTLADGSELWKKRIETMAALKIGGRWQGTFDPTKDEGLLEPRPELKTNVRHPGISLYEKTDPKAPVLYYGIDENGDARGWTIGKKSTMPHSLVIGPTGGGKTTVLRSLMYGALAQRIPVFACDPKMIELTPFYGFPGTYVASTPAEMANMIEQMEALMFTRYEQIKQNPNSADGMTPVLFILDELLILRQVLKRHWAVNGKGDGKPGRGAPPWFESIAALLALARSAKINVVIGVQRPDATLFDDGARDNLQHRISLMRLSTQGSQMLWHSPYVGVDLPMVQGRAMASPDGTNAIEMQTFWASDPITAEGEDRTIVEEFRSLAVRLFADYEMPIDVSPFENDPPSIDIDALPRPGDSVEAHETDAAAESDETESLDINEPQETVKADTLTEGDRFIVDGAPVEVVEVVEDPFDDDSVSITYESDGVQESVSIGRDEYVERVIDLSVGAPS